MAYIVLDLEFTELYPNGIPVAQLNNKKRNMNKEIIQIGAVKVSDELKLVDKLRVNVFPMYSGHVDIYVEKLTGLNYSHLKATGVQFRAAWKQLREFIGDGRTPILTWGDSDKIVLFENLKIWRQKPPSNPFVDLQSLAGQVLFPGEARKSVESALESLSLDAFGKAHDAFCDAWNEARIFTRIKDPKKAIRQHNPYYFQCGMVHDPKFYSVIREPQDVAVKKHLKQDKLVAFNFSGDEDILIPRFEHGTNYLKVWMDQGTYYMETAKIAKNHNTVLAYLKSIEEDEYNKVHAWYKKYRENLNLMRQRKAKHGTMPMKTNTIKRRT